MSADQAADQLTVGQLAAQAAVRADAIRYYEREGLLPVRSGPAASTAGTGPPPGRPAPWTFPAHASRPARPDPGGT